jgi:D-3-phosphoglycerate dehydrogenase
VSESSPKWRVLVSAPYLLPVLDEYRGRLESQGIEVVAAEVNERLSEEELLPLIPDIDGVICGDDRFTKRVFDAAPRLKVIAKWGTGIDSIDPDAARQAGVKVYNTPGAFTVPVADTVLGYVLSFARQLPWLNQDIQDGKWEKRNAISLQETTLGVVGIGDVGKAVVQRATAFGMRVLGHDIAEIPFEFTESTGLMMVTLDEMLRHADYVSLNCTLSPSSHHLINREKLALMKTTAYLINTCRGPVVDEPALAEALHSGSIAGAALDVFEEEPLPQDSPLRGLPNCLLAPHNANSSPEAWVRVHENTIKRLLEGLRDAG